MLTQIEIRGARTHNLKNIDCTFRHGELTVVTGVSGSGKSSLAFDTLYAEGQRRYVESLSTYARQFIERMERPDVDSVSGIQPAIALEQKNGVRSARSTVGTATEIYDYLRLLYAKLGEVFCQACGAPVRPETPDSALETLAKLPEGTRLVILGPLELSSAGLTPSLRAELLRQGWGRLWDGQGIIDVDGGEAPPEGADLSVVTDRLALRGEARARLRTALETAFQAGRGRARVLAPDLAEEFTFSSGMCCDQCGRSWPRPEPQLFSFYSPLGACPACEGFGRVIDLDMDKIIPNRDLCIEDGAIAPWNSDGNLEMYDWLRDNSTPKQIPRLAAIRDFTPEQWNNLLHGVGKEFTGIRGFFAWLEARRYKVQARVMLARYRAYRTCETCAGTRLRPEALAVRLWGETIAEMGERPVRELRERFASLKLGVTEAEIAGRALEALRARLDYLDRVGLGYLTLTRQTRTLSGGESQRINLASALGSALTETLYVLDEPTVGLHPRDTDRLVEILKDLRDLGNTLVVVEHDLEVIRAADRLLDLGPGAGEHGGRVLFDGSPEDLARQETLTAHHLATYHEPPVPTRRRRPKGWLTVRGARGHNLKGLTVKFPLGVLCCVTGVSGSGKTTLVRDTLAANYRRAREIAPVEAEPCDGIDGLEQVEALSWVDQAPLAGSSRSNPVTFVKAYEWIRRAMADTREARALGLTARDFSFNVEGGRCPDCKGTGAQTIDMHFMADIEVPCEACDGKRFQAKVLRYRFQGKSIHEILEMTVEEAREFFKAEGKIVRALSPLREVGLGYLRLGQSTTTLSGGEAQRLKLAAHLAQMRDGKGKLFIFDEPTTGLHPADLSRLAIIFQEMVGRGCSLIVIEHNMDLIAAADWVIDMGPEGGDRGGEIVAQGTLDDVMESAGSITGKYLRERFGERD